MCAPMRGGWFFTRAQAYFHRAEQAMCSPRCPAIAEVSSAARHSRRYPSIAFSVFSADAPAWVDGCVSLIGTGA
jgi:hypothetical protein